MAFKGKKEKKGGKYKFIRPEEIEELEKLPLPELLGEFSQARLHESTVRRQKKDDKDIADAKLAINKHRESFKKDGDTETVADKIKRLQSQVKELKEEYNEGIADIIQDKKDAEGGYNDSIKAFKERKEVIISLMDKKNPRK